MAKKETELEKQETTKTPSYMTKLQGLIAGLVIILVSAFIGAIIALIALPLILGVSPIDFYRGALFKTDSSKTIIKTERTNNPVVAVAKKVQPVVVNIKVKKISSGLFGDQDVQEGVGSGVIFRKDGYIVTNSHVVEGANEITVTLGNDKDVKGKVVGADSDADIAVVKINQNNLAVADIGKPGKLKVGDLVVATGSPFSFEHTVTSGIVSALNRPIEIPDIANQTNKTFTDLIQTDAAINPGNSGGALANEKGQVVGINTLIASQSGGSQGIGFAIPIDRALDAAKQLMESGKVSHPYIGMLGQTIDKDFAQQHKLSVEQGAIIREIVAGSPADKAGLKVGDVITEADGEAVHSMEDLITFIRRQKVGDSLSITYLRGGKRNTVKVIVAEKPKSLGR